MNFHLAQLIALPFEFETLRPPSGTRNSAAETLGIDTDRPVANRALGRRIMQFLAWLSAAPQRARHRAELARFSDSELGDIGLTRGDIGRIHDPAFAADHATGRATTASLRWL